MLCHPHRGPVLRTRGRFPIGSGMTLVGLSSGIWLFEDGEAFIPGLSSRRACFENECSSNAVSSSGRGSFEDKRSHNAVSSSQRDFFEDGREIPDRVGNDVGWFVLRDMVF